MCLVCGEQIALFRDYRLNPLCETKQREKRAGLLLANLRKATGLFTKPHTSRDGAGKTSFVISNKPSSEEFIKECLVAVDDSCDDTALLMNFLHGTMKRV